MGGVTDYDDMVTERAGSDLMPGPQDQVVEQAQSPDPVRLRESDRVDAELRERMERLPPGHPSSPYNGDGSPKPPVPDPFEHDLPIPGDPDYQPDAAEIPEMSHTRGVSSDDVQDHDSRIADGKPDQELPPDQARDGDADARDREERRLSQITDQVVARCREAEGRDADGNYGDRGLTPAMRRIEAQAKEGKLAPEAERYALKGHDRFMEKLVEMVKSEPDKSPEELANEIHDGIRYTFLFETEQYVSGNSRTN